MRSVPIVLLQALLLAGAAFDLAGCRGKGGGTSGVELQETILERRVKGAQSLLETTRKGKILDFDQVLVTVDQRLVGQLLDEATPYERVIDDKYRIQVNSAKVDFRANFALVELNGRGSLVGGEDETVAADVKVYGVLQVTGIDPKTGVLRARVDVIGLEVPKVAVMGVSAPVQGLVDALVSLPLEKLYSLASNLEIPVALEQQVKIPGVGPAGEVKIAPAVVPLRVAVEEVLVVAGKVWVTIGVDVQEPGQADSTGGKAEETKPAARAAGAVRWASRSLGSDGAVLEDRVPLPLQKPDPGQEPDTSAAGEVGAAMESVESRMSSAGAPPDSMTPRMKELRSQFEALTDSIKVATAADTLLWAIAADPGEVAVGIKPELINHLVQEATRRFLKRVELDINLGEEVDEGETVKVKGPFGKMITAGSWKVHVTVKRIQAILAADPPLVSVVGENRLRVSVPVRAVSGYGTATVAFTWDAQGVSGAACGDFQKTLDVDGNAVPRSYNVTGDLVLAAVGDRIVASPQFPVQKIRVSVSPSEATWAKVRTTMSELNDLGKCGIGMKVMSPDKIVALLTKVLTKGFNIKLPTKIVPTLDLPASVSESVEVEGREVHIAVKPRKLLVTPRAFWYSANVQAGVREIQPETNPAAADSGKAGAPGKGAAPGKGTSPKKETPPAKRAA
jgi:hypothetical protein